MPNPISCLLCALILVVSLVCHFSSGGLFFLLNNCIAYVHKILYTTINHALSLNSLDGFYYKLERLFQKWPFLEHTQDTLTYI